MNKEKLTKFEICNETLKKIGFPEHAKITDIIKEIDIYKNIIPNKCGIYILTYKDDKKYIGSSKNIRTRINSHIKGKSHLKLNQDDIKYVDIYLTTDAICARLLEYLYIKKNKPQLNGLALCEIRYNLLPLLKKENLNYEEKFLSNILNIITSKEE